MNDTFTATQSKRAFRMGWVLLLPAALLIGCGNAKGKIHRIASGPGGGSGGGGIDFMKSEILPGSPALADGVSEMIVVVRLLNSDNTPVVGFRPEYDIVAGTGVLKANCSISDNTGTAICVMRSNKHGTKRMRVTNITQVTLEKDLDFEKAPIGKSYAAIAPAGAKMTTAPSGWKSQATLGYPVEAMKATGSGYTAYGGVQGLLATEVE